MKVLPYIIEYFEGDLTNDSSSKIYDILKANYEKGLGESVANYSFVCKHGDEIIGGIHFAWVGVSGMINALAVDERFRGHGIGTSLLQYAEDKMHKEGCKMITVTTMSFEAPGFYLKHHYWELGRIKHFHPGFDYITLRAVIAA